MYSYPSDSTSGTPGFSCAFSYGADKQDPFLHGLGCELSCLVVWPFGWFVDLKLFVTCTSVKCSTMQSTFL